MTRQDRFTLLIYLGLVAFIAIFSLYISRYIINRPWTVRERVAAVGLRGKIYVLGGYAPEGQLLDDVLWIDPKARRMGVFSHLLSPREGFGVVAYGEAVYAIGGRGKEEYLDQVVRIDLKTKEAQIIGRLPGPRAYGGAAVVSGRIYFVGGWDGNKRCDEVIEINPATGQSQVIGHLPSPREFLAVTSAGGKIYAIGGEDKSGEPLDEIVEIDPATGEVLRVGSLPSPRARSAAVSFGDKVYVFGGWEGKMLDEIVEIDPSTPDLSVTVIERLPQGQADLGGGVCGEKIYLIGGVDKEFPQQIGIMEFNPQSGEIKPLQMRHFLWW